MTETAFNSPNYDVRPVLGRLMSGEEVIDRPNSHLHVEHELLERALGMINSFGRDFMVEEVFMGEQVGYSHCVETTEEDRIVYAFRPNRSGPTRFVRDRDVEPTESVTVILKRTEDPATMVLISAWAGNPAPPEPWDRNATDNSQEFWSNHALVWGTQEIDAIRLISPQ